MSTLLRVRISSFFSGVAVAGSVALIWLRDDVRRSFDVLHTQARQMSTYMLYHWHSTHLDLLLLAGSSATNSS